jgi:hypothetical protein
VSGRPPVSYYLLPCFSPRAPGLFLTVDPAEA